MRTSSIAALLFTVLLGCGGGSGDPGSGGAGGQGGTGSQSSSTGTGGAAPAHAFTLNDVSILFPLDPADAGLYRASDKGAEGELLPLSALQTIGPITLKPGPGIGLELPVDVAETYPLLRVVAMRIDPCFPGADKTSCRTQVRFVMQSKTSTGFADSALHVFYDLPTTDFDTLVTDLVKLDEAASVKTTGPLRVHPVLAAEGLDGAFAKGLKTAVFARIGAARLTRVTAMRLKLSGGSWEFHGFDFHDGKPSPIGIAGTTKSSQEIGNFSTNGFSAVVTPKLPTDADLSLFWDFQKALAADKTLQQKAFGAALTIENPKLRSVEEEGCVACHTALPARRWAENNLSLDSKGNPNLFTADGVDLSRSVDPSIADLPTVLHAFGYLDALASISQRTINESAVVAAKLTAKP